MTVQRGSLQLAACLLLLPALSLAEPQPTSVSTATLTLDLTPPDPFSAFSADRMVVLADGTRFVLGSGASNSANANYLLKVDPNGTQAWAVSVADPFPAEVTGLAVDASGNAYVAYTDFSNFAEPHARVVKFNAAGGQVASADLTTDTPGGDGFPFSEGVGVDSARGRVYAAYSFFSNAQQQDTFAVAALDTNLQPVATRVYDPGFTGSIGIFPSGGTLVDGNGDVWVVALQVPPAADAELLAARFAPDVANVSPLALTSPSVEEVGGVADPRGGIVAAGDRQADGNLYLHRVTASGFGGSFRFEGFDFVPSPMAVDPAGSLYILGFDPSTFFPAVAKVDASNGLVWDQPGPYLNLPETFSPGAVAAVSSAAFDVASVDFNVDPIPVVLLHYETAASSAADTTPPAAITDLAVPQVFQSSVTLTWTAPGDDASFGTATSYDLRHSTLGPILTEADFAASTQAVNLPSPAVAGSTQSVALVGLNPATTYFFAVKAVDEAGNAGTLSNSPSVLTKGAGFILSISTGDAQSGTITKASRIPLTIKVTDAAGQPVAGTTITFSTTTAPPGASGQQLAVLSTTTAADGTAATPLIFGNRVGTYTVVAACSQCSPPSVSFNAQAKLFLRLERGAPVISPVGFDQVVRPENQVLLTATAYGVDGTTDAVGSYPLALISAVTPQSGGHDHVANRPDGSFSNEPGIVVYQSSATGLTDASGKLFLVFTSTYFSGENVFTAISTSDVNAIAVSTAITVKVGDFVLLEDATYYVKDGGTCFHHGPAGPTGCASPDRNHYGTNLTTSSISSIATAWLSFAGVGLMLEINDMSLPLGGGFDVGGNWTDDIVRKISPPQTGCNPVGHCSHRLGTSADIQVVSGSNPSGLPPRMLGKLRDIITNNGGRRIVQEGSHWHIEFRN